MYDPCLNSAAPICAYAVLLFTSHKHDYRMANRYLPRYIEAAHKCLRGNSAVDLASASYVVATYSFLTGTPEEYMHRSNQFSLACEYRFKSGASKEEKWWLELLWGEVVMNIYSLHHREIRTDKDPLRFSREASLDQLDQFFQNSAFFNPTDLEMNQWATFTPAVEFICLKIDTLARHLQFYFDSYLLAIELYGPNSASTIRFKDELNRILAKLVTAIGYLPNVGDVIYEAYQQSELLVDSIDICLPQPFHIVPEITLRGVKFKDGPRERDVTIALLYYFCTLVQTLLKDPVPESSGNVGRESFVAALAICRICASARTAMKEPRTKFHPGLKIAMNSIMKRNLFWAGLSLNPSSFYYGTSSFPIPTNLSF